jgi:hypothetical protein
MMMKRRYHVAGKRRNSRSTKLPNNNFVRASFFLAFNIEHARGRWSQQRAAPLSRVMERAFAFF